MRCLSIHVALISLTFFWCRLSVRLEALGTFVVFFSAMFAVLNRDNINPGLAGLAIAYAMNVTSTLNWCALLEFDCFPPPHRLTVAAS